MNWKKVCLIPQCYRCWQQKNRQQTDLQQSQKRLYQLVENEKDANAERYTLLGVLVSPGSRAIHGYACDGSVSGIDTVWKNKRL